MRGWGKETIEWRKSSYSYCSYSSSCCVPLRKYTLIEVAFWVKEVVGDGFDVWDDTWWVDDVDDDGSGVVAADACVVIVVVGAVAVWYRLECTFLSWACWKAEARRGGI